VIYADILISWFLAAVLEIYTQHFTRCLHFTQQYHAKKVGVGTASSILCLRYTKWYLLMCK
jgi:hypothetical protein